MQRLSYKTIGAEPVALVPDKFERAKRTTLRTVVPANSWRALGATDLELRRWCVEQAIKWPQTFGSPYSHQQYPSPPTPDREADVIGRATKLFDWVTNAK